MHVRYPIAVSERRCERTVGGFLCHCEVVHCWVLVANMVMMMMMIVAIEVLKMMLKVWFHNTYAFETGHQTQTGPFEPTQVGTIYRLCSVG